MVVPKRRRRSRRIRGAVVDKVVHEDLDNDVDTFVVLNHLGQIGAQDADAHEKHETHENEEGEAYMPSPAGSDMSSLPDISEISGIEDMHDYAAQSSDDDVLPDVCSEGIVNVLSLNMASICASYAQENISGKRVNECISIAPFSKIYNEINSSISFCKDVDTFRHEMDQANHMNTSTRAYQNRKNNKHKIPHQKNHRNS